MEYDESKSKTRYVRPVFWAGLVGIPLLLATVYAYYVWYQVLIARGYGYVQDAIWLYAPFKEARWNLGIGLVLGFITYELTRPSLSRGWRLGYVVVLGMGVVLFAVNWIVTQFGPEPWWHHP
jgi:hypothetical protein